MKVKEIRFIDTHDFIDLCIENEWFTAGNYKQFDKLLSMISDHSKNITANKLLKMALIIQRHGKVGAVDLTNVRAIIYRLNSIVITEFEVVWGK